MDESHDSREIYCRRLGHYLTFTYCRSERNGLPCPRIADCWFDRIPIGDFLRDNYAPGELGGLSAPPPPKTATLVELIEQARRRVKADPPPEEDKEQQAKKN